MVSSYQARILLLGSHRKNLLVTFAMIGSAACMLFAAVGKGGALWAGLLAIIGNVLHILCKTYSRLRLEPASYA